MANDTICAIATAQGGAIGIVRVSGPDAVSIVNGIFSRDISARSAGSVVFGTVSDGTRIVDEVLVTIFRSPHSYTGEDTVEVSCHGSSYILRSITELLCSRGCRMANPGEYTQRAYLNGKMDLSQAEAVADLIASSNAAQHRVAMSQMRGAFSTRLSALREELLTITSLLELELDFSEEDVEFADRNHLISLARNVESEILRLTDSFRLGNVLKSGVPVAIIGAPNVGKSTLLNRLLHDDKAIVSDIQGTTRDTIEDTIQIEGITFRFIDTAGIRSTDDTIEQLGIERSIKAAERAHVIILLSESGVGFPEIKASADQNIIRVINKSDKDSNMPAPDGCLYISALYDKGIDQLQERLLSCIPDISDNDLIITNTRHLHALEVSLEDIRRSLDAMTSGLSGDLIAEDLRLCISHLSEILGTQITPNEVLGNIFSHFCIGK